MATGRNHRLRLDMMSPPRHCLAFAGSADYMNQAWAGATAAGGIFTEDERDGGDCKIRKPHR